MLRSSLLRPSWLLTAILTAGCLAAYVAAPAQTSAPAAAQAEKVSSFGKYSGYSEPVYDGWVRSSRFVTVRDGTRLAVDLVRPTRGGKVAWSNGNVGMYGRSYLGITQYMVAGQKPPHLKALFPEVAVTDMYELVYTGGIYHGPFIEMWTNLVRELDIDQPAPPVDEDKDGSLLKAAIEQHKANRSTAEIFAALPYRDSVDRISGAMPFRDWTPITYLKKIRDSKVAIYHLAGWYDRYVRDQLILYKNLTTSPTNPQRIRAGGGPGINARAMSSAV